MQSQLITRAKLKVLSDPATTTTTTTTTLQDMEHIGRRVSVYWPEEDEWFEGVITEKGQDKEAAPGVYNNVGWR